MAQPAPALLPIFRSEHQLRLLAEIFIHAGTARSLAELADASGVSTAVISREVDRLERAGLVTSARRGRLRLVDADRTTAYFGDLQSLLLKAMGPVPVLRQELGSIQGIGEAHVFGSWAARHEGHAGPAPEDVDVLVVGDPDLDEVYRACRAASRDLGLPVNPVVRSPEEWSDPADGFLQEVRARPRVQVLP